MYTNEKVRITYKCNWDCIFCNVREVNNFWECDIDAETVLKEILLIKNKYKKEELKNLFLAFSWWEPTLNKNLKKYILLTKKLWFEKIELQTNWIILYSNPKLLEELVEIGLTKIFIWNHACDEQINRKLWCFYDKEKFVSFVKFVKEKNLASKLIIEQNIVISQINLYHIYDYLNFLKDSWFFDILAKRQISLGIVQPHWYARDNRERLLINFSEKDIKEAQKVVSFLEKNNVKIEFHYTAPPLCILDYPQYNLEYKNLKEMEEDIKNNTFSKWSFENVKTLWKEKMKFPKCKKCAYDKYCSGFYKSWVDFYGKEKLENRVKDFNK